MTGLYEVENAEHSISAIGTATRPYNCFNLHT